MFTRPIFPSPVAAGWDDSVLGFAPSFAPRSCERRTSGWGQVTEHGPGTTLYVIDLAPIQRCSLETCDLTSHATKQKPVDFAGHR